MRHGDLDRRAFLALSALSAGGCALGVPATPGTGPDGPAAFPHADLEEATIADLSRRMSSGELTARDLVDRYLERIAAIDASGPKLRSVIETNPDAAAIAGALDAERRARGPRGPLHGIPVLVKDNIDTGDRMRTTAGSLALAGAPAGRDAAVVARLRAAGAVVLGKTNLSEWANIRSDPSTSGWSARGGLTRNPYCLDRNTSGSSSGSAAAMAANLAAVAVGTETDGSIVSPASICGLVGMKPTVGLLDGAGIVPISHTQDTAGPMTRTVADAALLLGAMAGRDFGKALDPAGARGARVGVLRIDRPWVTAPVRAAYQAALDVLRRLGATLVDPVVVPKPPALEDAELEVLLFELKADMATYLATRTEQPLRALTDLVRFNQAHAAVELRYFGQSLFEQAAAKPGLDSAEYVAALATCRKLSRDEGIDLAIAQHRLDAFVAPTGGPAWLTDLVNGDNYSGSVSTVPAVAGYPHITVPCGQVLGLPLGVSFFAGANQDATVLRLGYAFEQATKHRRPPRFLRTLPLP